MLLRPAGRRAFSSAATPSVATRLCGLQLPSVLFNSSNPFATHQEDLEALNASSAGAVATRTACPGFVHDEATMKWKSPDGANTINCLGYSPMPFEYYHDCLKAGTVTTKPAWFSISGYAAQCAEMIERAAALAPSLPGGLAVEINLSCPNIAGKPPIRQAAQLSLSQLSLSISTLPISTLPISATTSTACTSSCPRP